MKRLLSFPVSSHRFFNDKILEEKLNKIKTTNEFQELILKSDKNQKIKLLLLSMLNNFPILISEKGIQDRLCLEFDVFMNHQDDFIFDFLLVYEDIANFFKEKKILANIGRSSATCSLTNYLLGITYINPLDFNLPFNRFLTKTDEISIPFDCNDRNLVIQHLKLKYGSFFNEVKIKYYWTIKAAIKEVLKDYPYYKQEAFLKEIDGFLKKDSLKTWNSIKEESNLLNLFASQNPDLDNKINELLGSMKSEGLHAAGNTLSDSEKIFLDDIQKDKIPLIHILGLKNYEEINKKNKLEQCIKEIKTIKNKKVNNIVSNILKDKNAALTLKNFLKHNEVKNFNDLVNAEARSLEWFIFVNPKIITKNPTIKKILEITDGELLFQEQFMEIIESVFNVDKEISFKTFKNIVKKHFDGMLHLGKFQKEHPDLLSEIDQIKDLAPFLVCRAHCISYTLVTCLKYNE